MRISDWSSDVCSSDLSIRSRYDYRHDGGPDFGAIGNDAFWRDAHRRVIELPPTTVFTGLGRRGGEGLYRTLGAIPRGRGVAARLGVLARVALTPEDRPGDGRAAGRERGCQYV